MNLLKKCINGNLFFIVVKCVIGVILVIFWIELEVNNIYLVCLVVIMFWWFLNIDNVWDVKVWVFIWNIFGNNFFVILYMLGIINNKFWDVVKVEVKVFFCKELWNVFDVFVFDCILIILIVCLNIFFFFCDVYLLIILVIVEDGVIGYIVVIFVNV